MKTIHIGERIKAVLELADVPQYEVARAMKKDAGELSKALSQPDLDGWTAFRLGIAYHSKIHERQLSQSRR